MINSFKTYQIMESLQILKANIATELIKNKFKSENEHNRFC
jgi:hypothetical protein